MNVENQSPVLALARELDRAEVSHLEKDNPTLASHSGPGNGFFRPTGSTPEADFSAGFIALRYRLPLPVARVVASLARIGGRLS